METFLVPLHSDDDKKTFSKKLCFYGNSLILSYISAVIRRIPATKIDLLLTDRDYNPELIRERGLTEYHIVSPDKISEYEYILSDTLLKVNINPAQKLICFPHAIDNTGVITQTKASAIILPCETSMLGQPLTLLGNEYELLNNIPAAKKREVCHTGPFHIELPEITDKTILKKMIRDKYSINTTNEKPVIFVVDGENVHFSHVIYTINKLAEFATVIYKPVYRMPQKLKRKISSKVAVIYGGYANNLLRFAADFIMCEYFSGTCMSSLMLDLPVIPYYSRTIKHKSVAKAAVKPVHYLSYTAWHGSAGWRRYFNYPDPKAAMITYLNAHNLLFDIMDVARLRSMLETGRLAELYAPHLAHLQTQIFGSYMREGAPAKTAELIMRFVDTGTFGKDCAAVWFDK